MSLLLDALKRAEQEKLAKQQPGTAPPEPEKAKEAAPASASILELQPLARPQGEASARSDAQAALNVFAAKGEPPRRSRRGALWAMAAGILLVAAGGGGYLWYSLNALAPKTAMRMPAPLPPVTKPVTPAAVPDPAPASPAAAAAVGATGAPAPTPSNAAPGAATPGTAPVAPTAAPAATPSREDLLVNLVREAAREEAPAVKLTRPTEAPRVAPDIANGYEALRTGQLSEARRAYAAAMAADPGSTDATLGMATVEARSGNANAAALLYRKALELDPRNPTALAGLASIADYGRPDVVETQLRTDIARFPGSAALQVALGNLYASQGRWTEAQAAYFEAHRLEPAGADILFNLAVSLDRLGQPRVASGYYRRALEAARTQATQFDPSAAARRLAEIAP